MQTYEAITKRRSIREFQDKEIPRDDLIKLVDAGRLAATARNEQPWEFVVVSEKDKKTEIARITGNNGAFIAGAGAAIAVFCKDSKYYIEDGSAATENILLMATDLGIGSCWVAGDKKPYCEEIRSLFKAPAEYKLISLIALGYAAQGQPKQILKRQLKEVLHWQSFQG